MSPTLWAKNYAGMRLDNLQFIEQKNIASSHYANVYTIKNHTQYKLCVMAGSIVYQSAFEQVE